jgi:hypothetical protein
MTLDHFLREVVEGVRSRYAADQQKLGQTHERIADRSSSPSMQSTERPSRRMSPSMSLYSLRWLCEVMGLSYFRFRDAPAGYGEDRLCPSCPVIEVIR